MNLMLCADGLVGGEIAEWLLSNYPQDICFGLTVSANDLTTRYQANGVPTAVYETDEKLATELQSRGIRPQLGILAWWPNIVRAAFLKLASDGFINTHPSMLPHNRGKHYNFWSLVEQAPFGVSLHMVQPEVDSGDIVAQLPISYGWEDTGGTLYEKARKAMVALFVKEYPQIRTAAFNRVPQDLTQGSFHRKSELSEASHIHLDAQYTARDLLNRLRARTFEGHPACWFEEDDATYEVRVEIRRLVDDTV